MDEHNERVVSVAKAVSSFYERKLPFRVYHGSTNSTRHQGFESNKIVDISSLSHVIEVDAGRQVALVEPNVPMDRLVDATMKYELVPAVVPEFPGITVGGSYAGTAGESSSFKHGFFDRCVNWCEVVLGNGDVVRASPTERADLFYGAVGAFGSLGVTTLFEIQLVESSNFVEVQYTHVAGASEAISIIQQYVREDLYDFIDGILFSSTAGVIVAAKRLPPSRTLKEHKSETKGPVQHFTRAYDPWFYLHAEKAATTAAAATSQHSSSSSSSPTASSSATSHSSRPTELVPLKDYLFRYDRGGFWTARHSFKIFPWIPFNRVSRFVLDPLLRTRNMYKALHHSGYARRFVVQDLAIPAHRARGFVDWVAAHFGIWPLWLCPIRGDSRSLMHRPPAPRPSSADGFEHDERDEAKHERGETEEGLLINVGVWGPGDGYGDGQAEFDRFVEDNRLVERKVRQLGGLKWLYAQAFYTEAEFWDVYDRAEYDALREKYAATTLPHVFEKTRMSQTEMEKGAQGSSAVKGVVKLLLFMNPLRPK